MKLTAKILIIIVAVIVSIIGLRYIKHTGDIYGRWTVDGINKYAKVSAMSEE